MIFNPLLHAIKMENMFVVAVQFNMLFAIVSVELFKADDALAHVSVWVAVGVLVCLVVQECFCCWNSLDHVLSCLLHVWSINHKDTTSKTAEHCEKYPNTDAS